MSRQIILVDIGEGLALGGVLPSAVVGDAYSARLAARGGRAPYTYTIMLGAAALAAAGLNLDPATGELAGTASTAGGYPITVRATDLTGRWVERSYVLAVIAAAAEEPVDPPDGVVNLLSSNFMGYAYPSDYSGDEGLAPDTFGDITVRDIALDVTLPAVGTYELTVPIDGIITKRSDVIEFSRQLGAMIYCDEYAAGTNLFAFGVNISSTSRFDFYSGGILLGSSSRSAGKIAGSNFIYYSNPFYVPPLFKFGLSDGADITVKFVLTSTGDAPYGPSLHIGMVRLFTQYGS